MSFGTCTLIICGGLASPRSSWVVKAMRVVLLFSTRKMSGWGLMYLWRQRRRNLIIFRAAWSCFLVSKLLLKKPEYELLSREAVKLHVRKLKAGQRWEKTLNQTAHVANPTAQAYFMVLSLGIPGGEGRRALQTLSPTWREIIERLKIRCPVTVLPQVFISSFVQKGIRQTFSV